MCKDIEGVLKKTKDPNPPSVDKTNGALTTTTSGTPPSVPSTGVKGSEKKPDGTNVDIPEGMYLRS